MIRCTVFTEPENVLKYHDVWDELFHARDHEVSTSFEWTDALLATHLEPLDRFILLVLEDSERVLGLLPLVIRETKRYGMSIRRLFPISEIYNTHSDILLRAVSDEIAHTLLKNLFALNVKWDIFRMDRLVRTGPLLSALHRALSVLPADYRTDNHEPSFFVRLGDSYEAYLKKRSSKFRNHLKRTEKKMTAKGRLAFTKLRSPETVASAYDTLLDIETRSWKHPHGTAITSVQKQRRFYQMLCESTHKRAWLHLSFLTLADQPIAYNLGLVTNSRYAYLKTSYDEQLRPLSPSTILRARLIEDLISQKVDVLDFPAEPYEWERQWTDDVQWHTTLLVYNKTPVAKLTRAYNSLRRILTRRTDATKLRYHDPHDLKPS